MNSDHEKFILSNYSSPVLEVSASHGSVLQDSEGKEYLDFTSGIAVTNLGHGHPHWVKQVSAQAKKIVHCSNLFSIPEQVRLAKRIVELTAPGKMLFCNSGAEANEGLIKFARLSAKQSPIEGRNKIIAAENAFHGRTMGALSATSSPKYREGFEPLLDGFDFAPLNDLNAFDDKIDDKTIAVLVESIQGEGGIWVAEDYFLQGLEKICRERNCLLMLDEVQTGIARTGNFFGYQKSGIQPDAVAMAKGLGGGFPIGAVWIAEKWTDVFKPGSHGTTFGGSPLACSAAHAVLDVIESEKLVEASREKGTVLHSGLTNLANSFPESIQEVRGRGLMLALIIREEPSKLIASLRQKGLLVVAAAGNAIRFLPPLTVGISEIEKALRITEEALQNFSNSVIE